MRGGRSPGPPRPRIKPAFSVRVKRPKGLMSAIDASWPRGRPPDRRRRRRHHERGRGRIARRPIELGVIPLGTANDFARTLNIPAGLDAAARVIAEGRAHLVDLARANDAYFLNVASVGMSVSAMDELSPWVKHWFGLLAYFYAGARAFGRATRPSGSEARSAQTRSSRRPIRSSSATGGSTAGACWWRGRARSKTGCSTPTPSGPEGAGNCSGRSRCSAWASRSTARATTSSRRPRSESRPGRRSRSTATARSGRGPR